MFVELSHAWVHHSGLGRMERHAIQDIDTISALILEHMTPFDWIVLQTYHSQVTHWEANAALARLICEDFNLKYREAPWGFNVRAGHYVLLNVKMNAPFGPIG